MRERRVWKVFKSYVETASHSNETVLRYDTEEYIGSLATKFEIDFGCHLLTQKINFHCICLCAACKPKKGLLQAFKETKEELQKIVMLLFSIYKRFEVAKKACLFHSSKLLKQ